jgi:CubicO group peptidase (beta-lactamase class C family)
MRAKNFLTLLSLLFGLVAGCGSPGSEGEVPDAGAVQLPDASTTVPEPVDAGTVVLREGLPVATPEEVGIDPVALERMKTHAQTYLTDALIVIKDGKLVLEEYFGGSDRWMISMSASKSFVSLAVGFLVSEGKLTLDQRVTDFLPEWSADPEKAKVTIRHLLTHTSGLEPLRALDPNTWASLALRPHLEHGPMDSPVGMTWLYNNNAVDALGLVVELAAGEKLDSYLDRKLFRPIGGAATEWGRFRDDGPMAAGELLIRPIDMAKVGNVLANGGVHQGQALIDPAWISQSIQPSADMVPGYGLLWWLNVQTLGVGMTEDIVDYWRWKGLADTTVQKAASLVGQEFATVQAYNGALLQTFTQEELIEINSYYAMNPHFPWIRTVRVSPAKGFSARGWMGQWLFVYPERGLVVARMHFPTSADYGPTPPDTEYPRLVEDALALIGE